VKAFFKSYDRKAGRERFQQFDLGTATILDRTKRNISRP
jgi:hypothetical protein